MKKPGVRSVRPGNAVAALAGAVALACGAAPASAQTLGQQVSPTPYNGVTAQQASPAQAQPPAMPGYPGLGAGTAGLPPASQQLATGMDVPQASVATEISPGDLLDVIVFDTPELSGRFRVNNDGNIILPLVGPLHVGGLTARRAADAVTEIYQGRQVLLHPQVTVFVTEYASKGVTVTGEVRAPGIYPLTGPLELNDLLARAGGLNGDASKTVSIVHRSNPSKIITVKLNVGAQTPESIAASSVEILPGDTIFVARSGVVYVVGDLNRPGGYEVEHNDRLSLLDAVALAGGPTQTSKMWDARLIRRTESGREELRVDLKKVLYGTGPDMLMADGDILYVPISQRRIYTQQAIQAVIGAATAYGIYKVGQF